MLILRLIVTESNLECTFSAIVSSFVPFFLLYSSIKLGVYLTLCGLKMQLVSAVQTYTI